MKVGINLLLIVSLASCAAVRFEPRLDSELSEAGRRYLKTRSVIVFPGDGWENDLDSSLSQDVESPEAVVTLVGNYTERYRGHPTLTILSLGLIPHSYTDLYDFQGHVVAGTGKTPISFQYSQSYVSGWLASLYVLFPGWEYNSMGSEQKSSSVRAFFTVINKLAEEEEGP